MSSYREPIREVPPTAPLPSASQPPGPAERSLGDWLRTLLDGWKAGVAVLIAGVLLGLAATRAQETSFQASGTVIVSPARGFLDPQDADGLPAVTDTVTRISTTAEVLRSVGRRYSIATPDQALASERRRTATVGWVKSHLTVTQQATSSLIDVSGSAGTQQDARDLTIAALQALTASVNQPAAEETGVRLRLSSTTDDGQVSPTPRRNLLIGINAGLILGVLAALALGVSRRRLWGSQSLADEVDLPVIAALSRRRGGAGDAGLDEVMRRDPRLSRGFGSLLLTGAHSRREIADVADRLARSLADQDGDSVVIVDADLSGRHATKAMGLDGDQGLADLLDGVGLGQVNLSGGRGYAFLPSGTPQSRSTERLGQKELEQTLAELGRTFNYIVVCAPSLDRIDEVGRLLQVVDLGLLVASRGSRAREFAPLDLLATTLRLRFAGVIVLR